MGLWHRRQRAIVPLGCAALASIDIGDGTSGERIGVGQRDPRLGGSVAISGTDVACGQVQSIVPQPVRQASRCLARLIARRTCSQQRRSALCKLHQYGSATLLTTALASCWWRGGLRRAPARKAVDAKADPRAAPLLGTCLRRWFVEQVERRRLRRSPPARPGCDRRRGDFGNAPGLHRLIGCHGLRRSVSGTRPARRLCGRCDRLRF